MQKAAPKRTQLKPPSKAGSALEPMHFCSASSSSAAQLTAAASSDRRTKRSACSRGRCAVQACWKGPHDAAACMALW